MSLCINTILKIRNRNNAQSVFDMVKVQSFNRLLYIDAGLRSDDLNSVYFIS